MSQLSDRFGLTPAPGGLRLVQDLLNTRAIAGKAPDLLSTLGQARSWLAECLSAWQAETERAPIKVPLTAAVLPELVALRDALDAAINGEPVPPGRVPVTLTVSPDGAVTLSATGAGVVWLRSTLWTEVFQAQQAGTWSRLKSCRNPQCHSAFYDHSRNSSGVWHDVHTCGNVANLRASRQRKRLRLSN